jgi:hypothetical protein
MVTLGPGAPAKVWRLPRASTTQSVPCFINILSRGETSMAGRLERLG